MQQYSNFIIDHWLLSSAFFVVLITLIINEVINHAKSASQCSSQQLVNLMNHDHATVVDLRDKATFRNGHIANAKNIAFADITSDIPSIDKQSQVILVCANGQQSQKAAAILTAAGYTHVTCLRGGMAGWRADSLPVSRKAK